MRELCFVWGPPLSGQRRWMSRAADDTAAEIVTTLLPLDSPDPDLDVEPILDSLKEVLARFDESLSHHVYCELPWGFTNDAFLLEDWLEEHPEFLGTSQTPRDWNLSFIGICPFDAERLPDSYRRGLEEFSRSANSSILVLSGESQHEMPAWLGTDILDFGPRVDVFDEPVWSSVPARNKHQHFFTHVETLDTLLLPVQGDPKFYQDLMEDFAQGLYGSIWGAELVWKNSEGAFEALNFSQGEIQRWTSRHASLVNSCAANGGILQIAGFPLRRGEILKAVKSSDYF